MSEDKKGEWVRFKKDNKSYPILEFPEDWRRSEGNIWIPIGEWPKYYGFIVTPDIYVIWVYDKCEHCNSEIIKDIIHPNENIFLNTHYLRSFNGEKRIITKLI